MKFVQRQCRLIDYVLINIKSESWESVDGTIMKSPYSANDLFVTLVFFVIEFIYFPHPVGVCPCRNRNIFKIVHKLTLKSLTTSLKITQVQHVPGSVCSLWLRKFAIYREFFWKDEE